MESYIVRIYRRMQGSKEAVGVVEASGITIHERSFCNAEELWNILNSQPSTDIEVNDEDRVVSSIKNE